MTPSADDGLLHVVERLALLLAEAGMPRMPARVFAFVLADEDDHYTARELAEGMRVSPAAISGAVRHLVQMGLLKRGRRPGARSDHYEIDDRDVWRSITLQRLPLLERWESMVAEAAEALAPGSRGRRRLRETQAYYRFMLSEMPRLMERWGAERAALISELEKSSAA